MVIADYAAVLCVSSGVQSDGEPIRCHGRRVFRSISDRSDPGPAKPWHQEPLCKVAKPSPKQWKMCSTEVAANHHEVESQRARDAVAACTASSLSRPKKSYSEYNVNKSRCQPASTASRCQLVVPSSRLLASILPRTFAHTLVPCTRGAPLFLESVRQNTKLRLLALSSDRNLAPCGEPSRPIIRASPLLRPSRVRLQKLLCSVWS